MSVIISIRYIILLQSDVSIGQPFIVLNQQLNINHATYDEVDTNH